MGSRLIAPAKRMAVTVTPPMLVSINSAAQIMVKGRQC